MKFNKKINLLQFLLILLLTNCKNNSDSCPEKCLIKQYQPARLVGKIYQPGYYYNTCNKYCYYIDYHQNKTKEIQKEVQEEKMRIENKEILETARQIILDRKEFEEYKRLKKKFESSSNVY